MPSGKSDCTTTTVPKVEAAEPPLDRLDRRRTSKASSLQRSEAADAQQERNDRQKGFSSRASSQATASPLLDASKDQMQRPSSSQIAHPVLAPEEKPSTPLERADAVRSHSADQVQDAIRQSLYVEISRQQCPLRPSSGKKTDHGIQTPVLSLLHTRWDVMITSLVGLART